MISISAIANQIVEPAHAIFASVISFLFLLFVGSTTKTIFPRLRINNAADTAIFGAALFVLWCWFAMKFGMTISVAVNSFLCLCFLVGALLFFFARHKLSNIFNAADIIKITKNFVIFFIFAYSALLPWYRDGMLSTLRLENYDVYTYISTANYLQIGGASNIAGHDYILGYLAQPGLFHFMELFSKFYGGNITASAVPFIVSAIALIATIFAWFLTDVFRYRNWFAVLMTGVVVSGGFFRLIVENLFFSQLLCSVVALLCVRKTLNLISDGSSERGWVVTTGAFLPYTILLLFIYPALFVVTSATQFLLIVMGCYSRLREFWQPSRRMQFLARLLREYFWWAGAISAAAIIAALIDTDQTAHVFRWTLMISTKGLYGWPYNLISPAVILGIPGPIGLNSHLSQTVGYFGYTFGALACLCCCFFAQKFHTDIRQRTLYGTFAALTITYLAYYLKLESSYQQWKFASYSLLLFSFTAWAAILTLLGSFADRLYVGKMKARSTAIPVAAFLATCILANLIYPAPEFSKPLVRLSSKYEKLQSLNALGKWSDMYVAMKDEDATFVTTIFVTKKILHLASRSVYWPTEKIEFEKISPAFPLFVENATCIGAGVLVIDELGCLFLSPPSIEPDTVYRFSEPQPVISGLGVPEFWGIWNNDTRVSLVLHANEPQLAKVSDGYVNLELVPFSYYGSRPQRVDINYGLSRYRAVVGEQTWISIPLQHSDWSGSYARETTISFEFPDIVAPQDVAASAVDGRKLAIGFVSLSLTARPAGTIVSTRQER